MKEDSRQGMVFVLIIVFICIVECKSMGMKVYKCNNDDHACGCTRRAHVSLKILGGESALFNNWDWMVSIRYMDKHFCGGSILNEWYIITVAHCFENRTDLTSEMTVCAGTFRLSDPCHQRRIVDSLIIHPEYNRTTIENDIALIRLRTPLDLSDSSITPICLPREDDYLEYPQIDTEVVTIGWGDLKTNKSSNVLHQVTLKIMNTSSIFCNHVSNKKIQLCAGRIGKSISKGDSGGPLMLLTPSKKWQLIGLSSFMKPYLSLLYGSGYTFIPPFLQFIHKHIDKPSINTNTINCSCQCPHGIDSEYALSNIDSLDGCLQACIALPSNSCTISNTYACRGIDCAYSKSYNVSKIVSPQDQQSFLVESVFILPDGDKYEGQTKNGKKHGRGTYTWAVGDKYIGDWLDNSRTGRGIYQWPSGSEYVGEFLDNKRHGRGTYSWATGDKYIGDWFQDSKTGKGLFQWNNGEEYIGDWINDDRTGKGIYTEFNDNKYIGDWLNGRKTGKGVYIEFNGNRYVGDWLDGFKTGEGVYTWFNGDKYVGDWIENKRTGEGILTLSDGDKYEGQFKDGLKHGRGTHTLADGNTYVGEWVKDNMTGKGTYTWSNGDIYEGHFEDGEMMGYGTMRYSNGTIQKGPWPNGPFVYS